jgi:fermentation-respiration switch protein FrsA (DUF1100 family)
VETQKRLYAAAPGPCKVLQVIPDAGHGKAFLAAGEEYADKIEQFLDQCLHGESSSVPEISGNQ